MLPALDYHRAMRPYESLTVRGQVGRLRRLAADVLPKFGLPADTALTLLYHGENTTFRLRGPGGIERVLRIHRPDYQHDEHIRSEMAWLAALRRDTDVVAPLPFHGVDGDTLQHASAPGVDGGRRATCLEWIDGRFTLQPGSVKPYRAIGAMTAALHAHGQSWKRPASFVRRRWDRDGLIGAKSIFGDPLSAPGLEAADARLIGRAMERVRDELSEYGTGADRFGLIHADLHMGNVLQCGGRPAVIDFDDCGFGWYAYEFAVTLVPNGNHPRLAQVKAAWLEGYRSVRAFDDEHVEQVDLMWMVRRLAMLGWQAVRMDNPRLRPYLELRIEHARESSKAYLASGSVF